MPFFLSGLLTKHPNGKRFEHVHDGYKAVVIVDHDVVCYGNGFIVNGTDKVDGQALARACAIAMKATNETMRASSHLQTGKSKKVSYCVFRFLGKKSFNALCAIDRPGVNPVSKNAYPVQLKTRLGTKKGAYATVMRCAFMKTCVDRGQLAVHQLVHIMSHALSGDWDEDHTLWTDPGTFLGGKNLNRLCQNKWSHENDTK